MEILLSEFIKTGKFGPVEIGTSKDRVLSELDVPDNDTDLDGSGSILLYSWYEFFFDHNGILRSIQNDNYNPKNKNTYLFKNDKYFINSWFLNEVEDQTIETVGILLTQESISFEIIDYYGRRVLKASSGVVIDFDENPNEKGTKALAGVRYWP
jgi:hypothetical protein